MRPLSRAARVAIGIVLPTLASITSLTAPGCTRRPIVREDPTLETEVGLEVAGKNIDKIDLLFMIDDSPSMGDKQALLKEAVPDLVGRLLNPNCVDTADPTKVLGQSKSGACDQGKLEFKPIQDIHVGIISSSIGDRGSGAFCPDSDVNTSFPQFPWRYDDHAHLLNLGANAQPVADAQPANFLAWLPAVPDNASKPKPPVTALGDSGQFIGDVQSLVSGVGQYGCGFEAQEEAFYRFLVQPDPEANVVVSGDTVSFSGVDDALLKQRHDFLRPDSLVAIVLITDENESTVDPRSLNATGWQLEGAGGAPRPTPTCQTAPEDPSCGTCASKDASGQYLCAPQYFAPNDQTDDSANLRMFHSKQRFGVDAAFPIDRYVTGLTAAKVPNRDGEHPTVGSTYAGNATCTNPLFAASLPSSSAEEICNLPRGPRTPDMIFFAAITGVPHQLLHFDPNDPQKSALTDADWTKILGSDPLHYDFSGADPHMLESETPRAGLPTSGDAADAISGREFDTKNGDLEYACVFDLPTPKICDANDPACDCDGTTDAPLCDPANKTHQIRAKAYPGVHHLALAKAMKAQGIVSSICPIDTANADPKNPLYGYRPGVKAIVDQLKTRLVTQCLPRAAEVDGAGQVPCVALETVAGAADDSACDRPDLGLSRPDPIAVKSLRTSEGQAGDDLSSAVICALDQIAAPAGTTCEGNDAAGWCYVTGAPALAAGGCEDAVLFSNKGSPKTGSRVFLQCIEQNTAPAN